ncbi:Mannose-6-phosphate isomerase [Macleaya cordata]|uniref:mannose-6-phosphate isomerase n=1 Tax=Macleaya cordata TaxID=56857 RepID=A0A200Q0Z4_MACCD|nr:Mannose-6-phosphate isomerase [Macleaya cordata]
MGEEMKEEEKKKEIQILRCSVQNYDWGRIGEKSRVAKLFSLNSGLEIDRNKPYAEFWMGTHESGPSFVVESSGGKVGSSAESMTTLKSWISENPNFLGDKVIQKWGIDLPFLFKVLSVSKALSIQAHPDKELARVLHESNPSVYKDDNHKPEMALALTEFEALCGFVTLQELKGVLNSVPEIVELVGSEAVDQLLHVNEKDGEEINIKSLLKSIFTQLMSASKDAVSELVSKMRDRLNSEKQMRQLTDKEELVLRLEKQYPADVGVISAFFFNYVKLNPGEALYLDANEPHAYIYGECVECMATSDNVVRAGLTPKYRDVPTLCSMLTYKQGFPEILQGVPLNPYIKRYTPPFDEFEVDCCILPQGESVVFPAVPGPSLFLVTAGEGTMGTGSASSAEDHDQIREGFVLFVPADTNTSITASTELQIYRALVNNRFFISNNVRVN